MKVKELLDGRRVYYVEVGAIKPGRLAHMVEKAKNTIRSNKRRLSKRILAQNQARDRDDSDFL